MKKMALSFLIFSLTLTLNIAGQDISELDTRNSLDVNLDSNVDDFTTIECTLHSIERKPNLPCQAHNLMAQGIIAGYSLNWSGYVATTGTSNTPNPTYDSVTSVSGSWVVPTLIPNPNGDTFSSAWVGIDGYVNTVVEQIGTEHDVINGNPSYYAWFSLYPAPTQVIDGFPVNPGDTIEAKVSYQGQDDSGNSIFCLTIKNRTQKLKFSTIQHTLPGNPAHLSSADWIVEAPGLIDPRIPCLNLAFLPLANFTTISFDKCKAKINGRVGAINNNRWTFDVLTMISGSLVKSMPSALNEGCLLYSSKSSRCKESCFNVTWLSPGPFPYQVYCPPIVP